MVPFGHTMLRFPQEFLFYVLYMFVTFSEFYGPGIANLLNSIDYSVKVTEPVEANQFEPGASFCENSAIDVFPPEVLCSVTTRLLPTAIILVIVISSFVMHDLVVRVADRQFPSSLLHWESPRRSDPA